MANAPQSFANHTRWHPIFHFFIAPVILINFIVALVTFFRYPSLGEGWWVVVSAALVALTLLVRLNPLAAQDRVIRLEEQLRQERLLPAELAARAHSLTPAQLVALRFASDAELEHLVAQVVAGKITKPVEIKRAITQWRADTMRV